MSSSVFFVNTVVLTQHKPLMQKWKWCVSGRGLLLKGWLDFYCGVFLDGGYSLNKWKTCEVFLVLGSADLMHSFWIQ